MRRKSTTTSALGVVADEAYIDSAAVTDFAASTFSRIREKSEMGAKSVGRTDATALGDFPEAQRAKAVHTRLKSAHLDRFGELSRFIADSDRKTGRILADYDRHDRAGRAAFETIYGQES